jgi:hypothetical protein
MKPSINIETIHSVIDNSTWVSNNQSSIFKFGKGNDLSINGKEKKPYSLSYDHDKIVMQMGTEESYYIDYVNDFILNFYNGNDKFRLTPE